MGLPREIGGIPLDEIGATGWACATPPRSHSAALGLDLAGVRVAVQGFGAVGRHYARFMRDLGAVIVAVSDSQGMTEAPGGRACHELAALKRAGRSVVEATSGERGDGDAIVAVDCDIWVLVLPAQT